MTQSEQWHEIVATLRLATSTSTIPSVSSVAAEHNDPFRILVSTVISLRTKDVVTAEAEQRLFARAGTPAEVLELSTEEIARLIYPAGFYNTKAKSIRSISQTLVEKFDSRVPNNKEELLALPGVGGKTANLVLGLAFGIPAICVDTHVHRIPNRLGMIETRTPEQTEAALAEQLPKDYWIEFNGLAVPFGQQICTPVSPWCSRCPLSEHCSRVGVERSR